MRRSSARLISAPPISAFFGRYGGLRRLALFSVLFPVLFLFSEGCLGVGSYQPPDILPAGEKTVGLGVPLMIVGTEGGNFGILLPEIYGRVGLGHHMDLGWRFPLILAAGGGALLNLDGDLRYSPSEPSDAAHALLILRENLWMTSSGYLSLTIPMIGLGVRHTFVGAGPILHFASSNGGSSSSGLLGYRVEWTHEKAVSWGVTRSELTFTLFNPSPFGDFDDNTSWIVGAGVSFEIPFGRPQEKQPGSPAPKQQ